MSTKKKKLDMKILVITHDDLDGAGCVLVANRFFTDVEYISCHNGESHHVLFDFCDGTREMKDYDYIFYTDITPTSTGAINLFTDMYPEKAEKTIIIDHHISNRKFIEGAVGEELEEDNPIVKNAIFREANEEGLLECGTSLFLSYIKDNFPVKVILSDSDFKKHIKLIRYWDTFMWQEANKWEAVHLNFVFQHMGFDEFVLDRTKRFADNIESLSCPFEFFDEHDKNIINGKMTEIQEDMNGALYSRKRLTPKNDNDRIKFTEMMIHNIKDYEEYHNETFKDSIETLVVGMVDYTNVSIISHFLFLQYPDIDLIIFMIMNTLEMSYRTRKYSGVRCDLLAKSRGGGGHINASGSPLLNYADGNFTYEKFNFENLD